MFFIDTVEHLKIPHDLDVLRYMSLDRYTNLKSIEINGDTLQLLKRCNVSNFSQTLERIHINLQKTNIYKCINLSTKMFGPHTEKCFELYTCFGSKCKIIFKQPIKTLSNFDLLNKIIKKKLNLDATYEVKIIENIIQITKTQ